MNVHPDATTRLYTLSCDLAATYLRHNAVPVSQVPDLIAEVHDALTALSKGEIRVRDLIDTPPKPATPAWIRASITHDGLISFEDGRRYKALKRHLAALGLTPDAYRAKWGLPADYPMVCRAYSEHRSYLAQANNLARPGAITEVPD